VKDVGVQVTWPADTITYQSAIARDGQVQDAAVGDVPADTITYAGAIALTDGLGQASAAGDKVPHPANTITYDGSIAREDGQEAPAVGDVQATLSVDTITYNVAIARDGSEHGSTAGDVQETLQNDAISDSGAFALAREDHHEQDSAAGDVQTAHEDNGQVQASAVGDVGKVQVTRPADAEHGTSRRRWADYDDEDSDDEGLHDWAHQDDREAKRHLVTRRSKGERLPGRGVQPSEGAHSADEEERNKVRRPPQAGHRPVRHAPRGAKSSGGKHGKDKGKGAKDPDSAGGTRGQAAGSSRGTDSGKATKGGGKHRPPARGDQAPRPRGPDSITYQRAIAREHSQVHASVASTAPPSASRPAGSSKEDSGTQDAARREELRQLTERARRLNADLRAIPVQPGSQATAWALVGEFQADLLRTIQMRNPCTPDP
jgi:hypothetical protein